VFKFWTLFGHVFEPPLVGGGGLRTTYDVHLRLIGKRVVDFLLVLIELFSLGVTAESLKEIENGRFRSNAVTLTQNFR